MPQESTKNIIFFASGSGSNVENIANYFSHDSRVHIRGVFCNNFRAGVIDRCKRLGLPLYGLNRAAFEDPGALAAVLQALSPDLIVLAGFLWRIPKSVTEAFSGRIVNIHPALLPAYGGKGMYGMHVHEAVIAAGEKHSGITIHHVNEAYDEGAVILQAKTEVTPEDTPETLAARIHVLEYEHFPRAIESLLFPANG